MAARRLKCLFVSPVVPHPPVSGGRVRTYQLLRELGKHAEVHLRAVLEPGQSAQALAPLEEICASARGFERSAPDGLARFTAPKVERWFHSARMRDALREELARERYDVVHADELFVVRALAPELVRPVVVHHHKLDTRFQAALPGASSPAARLDLAKLRRLETFAARRTRFHALTCAEDAAALNARHAGLATCVVESGFDPDELAPSTEPRQRDELLFLGTLDYAPNVDGLAWFVREVLPRIVAVRPEVRVQIVGSSPGDAVRAHAGPNVTVIGPVADVRPHLARASGMIIPLRIGGGTRVKLVEALAMRTPVVSTTIGAEGLRFRDPEHLWLADSPEEFAARTLELLADPREAAARAARGRTLALEHYRWSDLAAKLHAFWQRAIREQLR